jgi:hypothetical protein
MRKVVFLLVAFAIGAIATVAYAQTQVNEYAVQGSISPNKGGTKAKPNPIQLKFAFQVSEASGLRPSPIETYSIGFYGGRTNGQLFPKCTATQMNNAESDDVCPKGSVVGTGFVKNIAGATNNPADRSIPCNLNLKIYNSGKNKAALWLAGGPPACAVTLATAIDAKYVSAFGGKGQALQFTVPPNLLHPLAGLDNAQLDVTSTIKRLTKKSKGVLHGYMEADQKCPKSKKAPIQVSFTSEAGQTVISKSTLSCR